MCIKFKWAWGYFGILFRSESCFLKFFGIVIILPNSRLELYRDWPIAIPTRLISSPAVNLRSYLKLKVEDFPQFRHFPKLMAFRFKQKPFLKLS